MRSKDTVAQFEHALDLLERQLERLQDVPTQLVAERVWHLSQFDRLHAAMAHEVQTIGTQILDRLDTLTASIEELRATAGMPQRDIPTVDELLLQAKSDETTRKVLETALAELEFSDPQIEFN